MARENCMRSVIDCTPCQIYYVVKIKVDEMAWHVACKGGKGNACKVLVGKLKGKRPHRRCGHSWEDNNKIFYFKLSPCSVCCMFSSSAFFRRRGITQKKTYNNNKIDLQESEWV
jgi:hypothetical protein